MNKFLTKWQWKWPANESIREFLYIFENEHKMVLQVKEKRSNGEKCCEWMSFDKLTGDIQQLQFKAMSPNKRQFHGDITLEWNQKEARMIKNDSKEVFEVKIAK